MISARACSESVRIAAARRIVGGINPRAYSRHFQSKSRGTTKIVVSSTFTIIGQGAASGPRYAAAWKSSARSRASRRGRRACSHQRFCAPVSALPVRAARMCPAALVSDRSYLPDSCTARNKPRAYTRVPVKLLDANVMSQTTRGRRGAFCLAALFTFADPVTIVRLPCARSLCDTFVDPSRQLCRACPGKLPGAAFARLAQREAQSFVVEHAADGVRQCLRVVRINQQRRLACH